MRILLVHDENWPEQDVSLRIHNLTRQGHLVMLCQDYTQAAFWRYYPEMVVALTKDPYNGRCSDMMNGASDRAIPSTAHTLDGVLEFGW